MKKLLCLILIIAGGAFALTTDIPAISNIRAKVAEALALNTNTNLSDSLESGIGKLDELMGPEKIDAEGYVFTTDTPTLEVHDDHIILTVSMHDACVQATQENVTIDVIEAEMANAETAKIDYILSYNVGATLYIGETNYKAVCSVPVMKDNLDTYVSIRIDVVKEDVSVTVYNLLQGTPIKVTTRLQHGTETTQQVTNFYYLNTVPAEKEGSAVQLNDLRK